METCLYTNICRHIVKMTDRQENLVDNLCPICMYILIQPVTMPCMHELCLQCFRQNVQEANLCCPLCRIRISTWSRRASRNKKLVNQKRWDEIQKNFPERVRKRMNGEDEDEDEIEELQHSIRLAEPGEIRMEYEEQLKTLREQALADNQKETEASEALIRRLQEEEVEKHRRLEEIERRDEELARTLSTEINESGDTCQYNIRGFKETRPDSTNSIESFINKLKDKETQETEVVLTKPGSPYPFSSYTPRSTGKLCVDKHKVLALEESFKRQKLHSDKKLITTRDVLDLENQYRSSTISRVKSNASSTAVVGCLEEGSSTVSGLDTLTFVDTNEILNQISEDLITEDAVCDIEIDEIEIDSASRPEVETVRSLSNQSNDSITQELSHFRPIRACPLTPPRKLPSGKFVEAPLIRTTPRNISKVGVGSPTTGETNLSDIDASSPIMQRRLSILAEERKFQVNKMSKSTATELSLNDDYENRNPGQRSTAELSSPAHYSTTSAVHRATEFQDISNSPLQKRKFEADPDSDDTASPAKRKLIIPLEANLDETDNLVIPPASPIYPVSGSLLSDSVNKDKKNGNHGNHARVKKRRKVSEKSKKQSVTEMAIHNDLSAQRSITDFMTKTNNVGCVHGTLSSQLLLVGDKGRDEVDGDINSKRKLADNVSRKNQVDKSLKNIDKLVTKSKTVNSAGGTVSRRATRATTIVIDSSESENSKSSDKRCRKELRHADYVYYTSPSKSDTGLVGTETGTSLGPTCRKLNLDDGENTLNSNGFDSNRDSASDNEMSLPKYNNTSQSHKSGKRRDRERDNTVNASRAMSKVRCLRKEQKSGISFGDYSSPQKENKLSQEEQDRQFALKLQKQFELEMKLHTDFHRHKGTDDAYQLRKRQKCQN